MMAAVQDISEILAATRCYQRDYDLLGRSIALSRSERTRRTLIDERAATYPRWQSGVERIDAHCGGFYGVTAIGGKGGAGKSTLALGSSLLAAESGRCVIYFDGENDLGLVGKRLQRWYGSDHETLAATQRLAGYWHRVEIYAGTTLEDLVHWCRELYMQGHHGLVIVLDSLNTLAEFSGPTAREGFDAMRDILFWADTLTRLSEGRMATLLLSELNGAGEMKGRKQQSTAQVCVSLQEDEDEPEVVRIQITKNRDGARGNLGLFKREWRTGRFTQDPN